MQGEQGFTLIELMVTVAIVAVLAYVAVPAYGDYAQRSKVADAVGQLAAMRGRMDEYFLDNRTFVGACTPGTIAPLPEGDDAAYFDFSCANLSAGTYTVSAVGKTSEGMGGFVYTIDQNNVRATLSVPGDWVAAAGCWTLRKDGSC